MKRETVGIDRIVGMSASDHDPFQRQPAADRELFLEHGRRSCLQRHEIELDDHDPVVVIE